MVALIVSDRDCFTPELARKQKKIIVMVEANIHAGEVEGKESVLALARDLTAHGAGQEAARQALPRPHPELQPGRQ